MDQKENAFPNLICTGRVVWMIHILQVAIYSQPIAGIGKLQQPWLAKIKDQAYPHKGLKNCQKTKMLKKISLKTILVCQFANFKMQIESET